MADRYFRVDVSFFHKRTCQTLIEKLGPWAPLVFLSLVARCKDSGVPGTFIYPSEAVAWEKLGFEGHDPGFTLDELLDVTGKLKQTSRTRVGRLMHVKLSHYERWQKDSKTYEARVRKSRSRAQSKRDTDVTGAGQARDTSVTKSVSSSSSISTPLPPMNGKSKGLLCDLCPTPTRHATAEDLAGHLEDVHGIVANGDHPLDHDDRDAYLEELARTIAAEDDL